VLNYIWCGMMLCSMIYAFATGTLEETLRGCFSGTEDAVTLLLSMAGLLSFWNGLLKVAQAAGILNFIEQCLIPVTKRLFPNIPVGSDSMKKICANITANLFGLGNAATPFGITAVNSMKQYAVNPYVATDDMCTFILLNTASIQLIPSTVIAMRSGLGSISPASIIPFCWITSITALLSGLLCAKIMRNRGG